MRELLSGSQLRVACWPFLPGSKIKKCASRVISFVCRSAVLHRNFTFERRSSEADVRIAHARIAQTVRDRGITELTPGLLELLRKRFAVWFIWHGNPSFHSSAINGMHLETDKRVDA
jgi:hypothetical protein